MSHLVPEVIPVLLWAFAGIPQPMGALLALCIDLLTGEDGGKRGRESVCEGESSCVCVWGSVYVCLRERGRENVRLYVGEREREIEGGSVWIRENAGEI